MSQGKKQVRFKVNGDAQILRETLVHRKIETPHLETNGPGKKKKGKKKEKVQVLKAVKKKLKKDLRTTKEGIAEDNIRKANPSYTPYENRQRLARVSSDTISKLRLVKRSIVKKEKSDKARVQRRLKTKLQKRSIRSDKQNKRLLKMTTKLEKLKLDEGVLRAQIEREKIEGEVGSLPNNGGEEHMRLLPIKQNLTGLSSDGGNDDSRPVSVQSECTAIQLSSHQTMKITADKLAHKYEMTRELRNTIHEHMISRSYNFSYFNIIPPYKRSKPKPQKTKQGFNRFVYEDKIGVVDFNKRYPQKVVLKHA